VNAPESAAPILPIPRSSAIAALLSAFVPGVGQIYNKQLEKAVLLWIWFFILLVIGLALLLLGTLARWLPAVITHPPLSDWVRANSGALSRFWFGAGFALWLINLVDAVLSARRISSGRTIIRHPIRWQLVHVLGSQLLGFIPIIGIFFPPGIVAEAIDARRENRQMNQKKVLREGGVAVAQWAIARIAFYALWILIGAWALWWIFRAIGWAH
jgi:hypothetical protein